MRYYINERTGVTAAKSFWDGAMKIFCESDGKKDFNLKMDTLEADYFLKDPETKQVNEIEAETFALLQSPAFADSDTTLMDEFLSSEALSEDWMKCVDEAGLDTIMNEQDWRDIWLDPERVEMAQEVALAEHSDISAWLEKNDYILSDADKIRLIVATGCLGLEDETAIEIEDDEAHQSPDCIE